MIHIIEQPSKQLAEFGHNPQQIFTGKYNLSNKLLQSTYNSITINNLRTYATKYFPCWNLFNTLHTVCFMHGLSIYEIKSICHHAYFFIIPSGSFQHLTNFLNRWKNIISPKFRAKIAVIFSQLLSINLTQNLKPFGKCASLFIFPSFDKILHDIFWQFVEN